MENNFSDLEELRAFMDSRLDSILNAPLEPAENPSSVSLADLIKEIDSSKRT